MTNNVDDATGQEELVTMSSWGKRSRWPGFGACLGSGSVGVVFDTIRSVYQAAGCDEWAGRCAAPRHSGAYGQRGEQLETSHLKRSAGAVGEIAKVSSSIGLLCSGPVSAARNLICLRGILASPRHASTSFAVWPFLAQACPVRS